MDILSISYLKEKWQHAGFQRYFQNMGWSFSGRIFSLLASLFVGALVARYLGPERYGILNYALSFVSIFGFLSSFGIDNILVRDIIKYRENEDEILSTAFILKLIGGIIIVLVSTIASVLIKNDLYTTLLVFIYSLTLITAALNVTDNYFQSIVKYKYALIAQITSTVLVSILKLYLMYEKFGTGWFIGALVFETGVSAIILFVFFIKNGKRLNLKFNSGFAKKMLADAWPFIFTAAFYLIYSKIDQVMIGKMLDTISLGIYAAGVKLAEIWYFVPTIISGVLFPAIMNAKMTHDEIYKNRLKKIFVVVLAASTAIALFEFIFAKYLILILFGKAYSAAVIILKIYTWAGIVVALNMVLSQYLTIENRTKIIMYSSFAGAFANVMLNVILIPRMGITGSAWATLISYSFIPIIILANHLYSNNDTNPPSEK